MKKRQILVALSVLLAAEAAGCSAFPTAESMAGNKKTGFCDAAELESGKAYVWHHEGGNLKKDLENPGKEEVYFTCITGDYSFKKKELEEVSEYPRNIWVDAGEDERIPTVTKGDCLLYVSKDSVPDSIVFERFADYGYTIGVSGLSADEGGHYYLTYADVEEDDYKHYIDMNSDAGQLAELSPVPRLYLDKAGDVKVDKDSVSDGGTVLGLTKGKTYVCEFYTGTYYQDFALKADIHSFVSMERFVSHDYEFMHSSFIRVPVPDYLKSGYYFVNGAGLFRYVAKEDWALYNGNAYDPSIDWNDPVILYNRDGTVRFDPSALGSGETEVDMPETESAADPGEDGGCGNVNMDQRKEDDS